MVWNIGFNDGMGVTYSLMEMDGDIRKIEYVEGPKEWKSVGGGFEPGKLNAGRHLKPDYVPTKFLWGGPKNRKLPDALHGRGMLLVSEKIKIIIEKFEPAFHQFFPVDVNYKSSNELAQKMYFLNICTRIDSVDHELSTCELQYGIMWRPDIKGELVFNIEQIGDHHLWHDKHIMHGWLMSDALHDALTAESVTGLVFHKNKSNREWA
jgi:hypothetical protein